MSSERRSPSKSAIAQRVLANRAKDSATGCWNWTGARQGNGYGRVTLNGCQWYVHRLAAALYRGIDLADTKTLTCHHCDNPSCFNPRHLFSGTARDNLRDMERKGRARHDANPRGERHPRSKLKDVQVCTMRHRYAGGAKVRELAGQFDVNSGTVWAIVHRKMWTHV